MGGSHSFSGGFRVDKTYIGNSDDVSEICWKATLDGNIKKKANKEFTMITLKIKNKCNTNKDIYKKNSITAKGLVR